MRSARAVMTTPAQACNKPFLFSMTAPMPLDCGVFAMDINERDANRGCQRCADSRVGQGRTSGDGVTSAPAPAPAARYRRAVRCQGLTPADQAHRVGSSAFDCPPHLRLRVPAMPMPRKKTLRTAAGVVASFVALAGAIMVLLRTQSISVEMAKLMLVALLGLYVGFGVLIAVYRFIGKLD